MKLRNKANVKIHVDPRCYTYVQKLGKKLATGNDGKEKRFNSLKSEKRREMQEATKRKGKRRKGKKKERKSKGLLTTSP